MIEQDGVLPAHPESETFPEVALNASMPFSIPIRMCGQQFNALLYGLDLLKRLSPNETWAAYVEQVRNHRAFHRLQLTPLNQRAFEKPRGYAGDALTLDFIYGVEPCSHADPWVEAAHEWGTDDGRL